MTGRKQFKGFGGDFGGFEVELGCDKIKAFFRASHIVESHSDPQITYNNNNN